MAIERITDTTDLNNFGVLFHSTKVIEAFQKKSGMEGVYSVEYQHHYISAVARLEAEGQILDIAIPLAMYNYHQEVGGASVEFNMEEVNTAAEDTMDKAIAKFEEFTKTHMYTKLVQMGLGTWNIYDNNSIHAHPNGVNRFSGTDLRKDITHPGVNFPLSVGVDLANFASIIQHKDGFAELIHSEYRIFNGVDGGERAYKKGRTLDVVKGIPPEPEVVPEFTEDGIIDMLFGTSRALPVVDTPIKKRESYFLEDGFHGANIDKLNAIKEELMTMWEACDFEMDISNVLKTNIFRGRGRLLNENTNTYWKNNDKTTKIAKLNEILFEEEEKKKEIEPSDSEMRAYIRKANLGHTLEELFQLDSSKLSDIYWMERLDEYEDEVAGIEKDQDNVGIHFNQVEQLNMLVADGMLDRDEALCMTKNDIAKLFEEIYGSNGGQQWA